MVVGYALQRGLTGPLTELAGAARRIAENQDYSVRVKERGHDEVGTLTHSFNTMVQTVEQRNAELVVAHRTAEEARESLRLTMNSWSRRWRNGRPSWNAPWWRPRRPIRQELVPGENEP